MSQLELLLLHYYREQGFDALSRQEVFEWIYLELKCHLQAQHQ